MKATKKNKDKKLVEVKKASKAKNNVKIAKKKSVTKKNVRQIKKKMHNILAIKRLINLSKNVVQSKSNKIAIERSCSRNHAKTIYFA
jgi:hypothetical protein